MWSRNFKFLLIYSHIKNLQVFIGAFSQISTGKIWLCSQCGSWEKFPYLGSSLGSAQTSSWQILMQFGASIITMSGITSGIQAVSTTGLSRMAQSSNLHMGWNIMIRAKSSQWSSVWVLAQCSWWHQERQWERSQVRHERGQTSNKREWEQGHTDRRGRELDTVEILIAHNMIMHISDNT